MDGNDSQVFALIVVNDASAGDRDLAPWQSIMSSGLVTF